MTSAITEDGSVAAVTLLSAPKNVVTQIRDMEKDGYCAVQLGAEEARKLSKALAGHLKPSKAQAKIMREIRVDELPQMKIGDYITADLFSVGDKVHVTGTSKGKGFAGTIKRHNFSRQRKTHGAKGATRRPGSIGSMYPQKIFKGKKMSGHMGNEQVTTRNLRVALVDKEREIIGVYGAIPGPRKSIVVVKGADK